MRTAVAIGVLIASTSLAVAHAWFVPLAVDGGWYSYPGYALSMGRDPAENLLSVEMVSELPQSVRALFGYELRSLLLVPFHATWFTIAGASVLSLKIFGALQWLLLAVLVGACVKVATGDRRAAYVAALAALADSWVISGTMVDLRPDVPNAIASLLCALALLSYQRSGRMAWLLVATVGAMGLSLVHITSVLGLTFVSMLAVVLALWPRELQRRRMELLLVPMAAGIVFLLRQPIMDVMVPTEFLLTEELPFRDDLAAHWQRIVEMGAVGKLALEFERWFDYFFVGNVTQLLFIVVGVAGLAVTRHISREPVSMAFMLAALVTIPISMIIDPTETRGHLIPLTCLAYIGAGIGFAAALRSPIAPQAIRAMVAIGIIAIALRGAMAVDVGRSHVSSGVSNQNLVRFMADIIEPDSHQTVIAPTFLWPYVGNNGSVVLLEPGARLWHAEDERWPFVSKVIIDQDLSKRGWSAFSARMEQCSSFIKERSVGSPTGDGFFLQSYRIVAKPCGQVGD